jgi:hypothetical protein
VLFRSLKDIGIDGLYWAIPTTELSHRSEAQRKKYTYFLSLGKKDFRSCYYHRAKTTVDAIYKISSCFPVIEKYVEHEFTTSGNHVILQQKNDISEISRKLHKILAVEQRRPNYFAQHITDIKYALIKELAADTAE